MYGNAGGGYIVFIKYKRTIYRKGLRSIVSCEYCRKSGSLLFVPFLNKILGGEAGYSVYYSANQVFAFVYVLTTAGLPVAISKLVTELTSTGNRKRQKQAFRMARTLMVLLGVALSVIMAIFAKPIARYMNNEDSWMGILTLAPTVLICSLLSAYRGYLQGMKNMTPTAVSQVVEQIVHVAVSVVLVLGLRSRGIVWAVAGASIGTAVGAAAALIIVIKYYGQYQQDQRVLHAGEDLRSVPKLTNQKLLKLILYYSLPITINSGIQYGGNMIDTSIMKGRLMAAGLNEYDSRTLHGMMGVTRQLLNVPTALVIIALHQSAARNRRTVCSRKNMQKRGKRRIMRLSCAILLPSRCPLQCAYTRSQLLCNAGTGLGGEAAELYVLQHPAAGNRSFAELRYAERQ